MSCQRHNYLSSVRTVKATLKFLRDELIYDCENYTFVEGDIAHTDDAHDTHAIFDVAQDGNEDICTRMFALGHAECLEALYPFTKKPVVADMVLDDTLQTVDEYVIELDLPTDFSQTSLLLIKELVHKYLVLRVLAEWLGITKPQAATLYMEQLEQLRAKMRTAVQWRCKALRIKQSLF